MPDHARIDELIAQMTPAEKAGQLSQYFHFGALDEISVGPEAGMGGERQSTQVEAAVARGEAGSLLFVIDPAETNRLQRLAIEGHRLGIPVLFGFDVIHGLRTILPVPIALAASWDPDTIERGQAVAAREARAVGIRWTFAPMVDIARDPRWGRMIEGAGEDPFLGAAVAAAQVRGFQGEALGAPEHVIAGVKHFAGYGAALGGRDYDEVDVSDAALWNVHLPPFAAAIEAGAGNVMTAYMALNGIPATGNRWLFTDVLRAALGFEGFVVSDANAVRNLVTHGFARDLPDAAARALTAGCDMEMAIADPAYAHLPGASTRSSSTPASGACSRPSCASACSTSPTSTRSARARCSPIRPTAKWRASPPSARRCCCATRARSCRWTPAAGSPCSARSRTRGATRWARGASAMTSTRP